jgi:Na+/melibiose symporter-like transporter
MNSEVATWKKIAYGLGFLGYGIQSAIVMFFQSVFLLEVVKINPV